MALATVLRRANGQQATPHTAAGNRCPRTGPNEDVVDHLGQSGLLSGLDSALIRELASVGRRHEHGTRSVIFAQGDEPDAVYIMLSGQVAVNFQMPNGREITLDFLVPPQSFGESAAIDGLPRMVSAVAATRCEVLAIGIGAFCDITARHAELQMKLLEITCQRLRMAIELLEDIALLDLPAKLGKRLLTVGGKMGSARPRGPDSGRVRLRQRDLAMLLGVSRQAVNQQLRCWAARGWIQIRRNELRIVDSAAIASLVAQSTGQSAPRSDLHGGRMPALIRDLANL
jgi:CRP-like cAMP-binding protein